jgi:Fe-S cluster assembly iron-binding protein IscA
VLTLTDQAADVVRAMTRDASAPDHAGVRLSRVADAVEVSLTGQPAPGDDVIVGNGMRVFVERGASWMLDGHVLDGTTEDGVASFALVHDAAGSGAQASGAAG